jgi:hypothetical protein
VGTRERIEKLRKTASQMSTELNAAPHLGTPPDTARLLNLVANALLNLVGLLEEVDGEIRRMAAERAYLRRRGWQ